MKNREVYLIGEINAENINKTREKILELLRETPEQEIILLISSGGGGGSPALSFYEWVRLKNIPLTTIAIGEVSSAAVIVFLSGIKRKATPHSWFCIHKGGRLEYEIWLKLLKIFSLNRYKDEVDWLKTFKELEGKIIQSETQLPAEEIKRILTKAHRIFSVQEAKNVGLIHEII